MRKIKITTAVLFISLLGFFAAEAQITTPTPSPMCKMEQNVGLGSISLEYSRPGVKGRKIFGGLVPYGEIWRTGANSPTKITFSEDVTIQGKEVAAGDYAMYTIPGESEWTMILNSDETKQAWDRDEAMDVVNVKIKSKARKDFTETFTINVGHIKDNYAHVQIIWENTMAAFQVDFSVDEKVMKNIEAAMAGPSYYDKYRAARYYFENDKDMEKAHQWISEACEEEEKFWMLRWKAEIEAGMGNYKQAIETAKKSKELAIAEENKDYVKINDNNIAKWSKK